VRLGGLDWLVMSSKLQICASPCLDQMLHQIQCRQNLPPMCSTMTQPSRPAVHHVRQSKQAGLAQFPEAVNLSDCPMSRQGLANSFHTNRYVSRFLPAVGLCIAQRNSSCDAARHQLGSRCNSQQGPSSSCQHLWRIHSQAHQYTCRTEGPFHIPAD